jgi:hypothetical protein
MPENIVVQQNAEVVAVEYPTREVITVGPGVIPGPRGRPPDTASYRQSTKTTTSAILTLDVSEASTFFVNITRHITSVVFTGWPEAGIAQKVAVYVKQDSTGGWTVGGWPAGMKWNSGAVATIGTDPNNTDCMVFDSFDEGTTIYGTMVGLSYS